MSALDAALIAAHATGDAERLVCLYRQAAAEASDLTARGFYLTHAYVFALEANLPAAPELRQHLIEMGRETPL